MTAPAMPTGATMLTADEAAHAVVTGDHPQVDYGNLDVDHLLILMIRAEVIQIARLADRRLVFLVDQTRVQQLAIELGVDLGRAG